MESNSNNNNGGPIRTFLDRNSTFISLGTAILLLVSTGFLWSERGQYQERIDNHLKTYEEHVEDIQKDIDTFVTEKELVLIIQNFNDKIDGVVDDVAEIKEDIKAIKNENK